MLRVILTEDQVLDAIDRFEKNDEACGLCNCFEHVSILDEAGWVYSLLIELGGAYRDGAYFWDPYSKEGQNARALFLAFMLEWSRQ